MVPIHLSNAFFKDFIPKKCHSVALIDAGELLTLHYRTGLATLPPGPAARRCNEFYIVIKH